MHQSYFSYNLSRPYPYRWFTWVVVFGGIIALIPLTVINFAANGFEINTVYVSNPTEIENPTTPHWYQKAPWSFVSKVSTSCQDQVFEIGSQLYTNNTWLSYTLAGVTVISQNQSRSIGSFTYHNEVLHDCVIWNLKTSLTPFVEKGILKYSQDTITKYSANVSCTIKSNSEKVLLNFMYYSENKIASPFETADIHNHTQPALWWAGHLIEVNSEILDRPSKFSSELTYRDFTEDGFFGIQTDGDIGPDLRFQARFGSYASHRDMFHRIRDEWLSNFGPTNIAEFYAPAQHTNYTKIYNPVYPTNFTDVGGSVSYAGDLNATHYAIAYGNAQVQLLHSYLLTDLGQATDSNIFASPSGIVNYLNATRAYWYQSTRYQNGTVKVRRSNRDFIQTISKPWDVCRDLSLSLSGVPLFRKPFECFNLQANGSSQPITSRINLTHENALEFYQLTNTIAPFVTPAVLNALYMCKITTMKPIGAVISNVIVADLVLLQTIWVIFNWVVKFVLERQNPEANHCLGCPTVCPVCESHLGTQASTTAPRIEIPKPLRMIIKLVLKPLQLLVKTARYFPSLRRRSKIEIQ